MTKGTKELGVDECLPGMIVAENVFDSFGVPICWAGETLGKHKLAEIRQEGIAKIVVVEPEIAIAENKGEKEKRLIEDAAAAFEKRLERCLSMVAHHDEIRQLKEIIKRIHRGNLEAGRNI
jgi:hypothetical protein